MNQLDGNFRYADRCPEMNLLLNASSQQNNNRAMTQRIILEPQQNHDGNTTATQQNAHGLTARLVMSRGVWVGAAGLIGTLTF